jgi:hypothetical protein
MIKLSSGLSGDVSMRAQAPLVETSAIKSDESFNSGFALVIDLQKITCQF